MPFAFLLTLSLSLISWARHSPGPVLGDARGAIAPSAKVRGMPPFPIQARLPHPPPSPCPAWRGHL